MRLLTRLITRGGIFAFFFFSYILMLLWNSVVAGHFGWAPTLSYLQSAGLWLLVGLATAGAGICARLALAPRAHRAEKPGGPDASSFSFDEDDLEDDLGERVERRIRRAFARWVDEDASADWDRIGERIERKIRDRFREWVD